MKNGLIGAVLIVVVVLGAVYFVMTKSSRVEETTPVKTAESTTGVQEKEAVPDAQTSQTEVHLTARGFSPATLTVKKGTTVTFINDTTESMWVGSDQHPSHTGYAGTSKNEHCPDTAGVAFDQCAVGNSYSFTFNKVGTWGYHNHTNAGFKGAVTVTE